MKITIESTDLFAPTSAGMARVWTGTTENGVKVFVLIAAIGCNNPDECERLAEEFVELKAYESDPPAREPPAGIGQC